MDTEEKLLGVFEHNLRHLPFPQQVDRLAALVNTGDIAELPYRSPEDRSAFQRGIAKIDPPPTPAEIRAAAKRLTAMFIQREIDRAVAQRNTARIRPKSNRARPAPLKAGSRGPTRSSSQTTAAAARRRVCGVCIAIQSGVLSWARIS
jgi:hypothetical protein